MLIVFRGLGLVWGFLGVILLLPVFFVTGSLGVAFSVVAACWIYFGRGHFEPGASRNQGPDGKRIAPAVFFIPVWVYGILVIPLALGGFFLDLTVRGRNEGSHLQGQSEVAESTSVTNSDKERFQEANHAITSARKGSVHGNTERARELAAAYSGLMKELSEAAFTGGGQGIVSMTDGEFLVYCQMNEEESVAFLVHVPQLRQYKDEVRDTLSDLCWKAASTLVKSSGVPEDIELAVALRGTLLYGPIMIDRLQNETTADDRSEESLYRFFPEASEEIPEAVEGTTMAAEETSIAPVTEPTEGEPAAIGQTNNAAQEMLSTESPDSDLNKNDSSSVSKPPTASSPLKAGPDGPGMPITLETQLGPGQKLAGFWGGEWSQVVVTGFAGDDVLTGWVHSNDWTSFKMPRSKLRLVNEEEYAQCKISYSDEPVTYPPLGRNEQVSKGQQFRCRVEKFWLQVEVNGPESDAGVPIHWIGFSSDFDELVPRSRLAPRNALANGIGSRLPSNPSTPSRLGPSLEENDRNAEWPSSPFKPGPPESLSNPSRFGPPDRGGDQPPFPRGFENRIRP